MTISFIYALKAADEILALELWWRTNRPAVASRFTEELKASLALLAQYPLSGQVHRNRQVFGTRRLLLPETKHYLYYTYDPTQAQIQVLSVWSTYHRRGPKLVP